uniref:Uncharacterized protein n=1 Tax=Guillardia theta TaxID=55529 RepID=A0A6U5XR92_GUITH|mmetsp:Transcript_18718/g.61479  ORF Transcript_18718/g.61479 Transcript_18718/m.61479 type:complete len:104 (+) Transcript_18718:261-572(+)
MHHLGSWCVDAATRSTPVWVLELAPAALTMSHALLKLQTGMEQEQACACQAQRRLSWLQATCDAVRSMGLGARQVSSASHLVAHRRDVIFPEGSKAAWIHGGL